MKIAMIGHKRIPSREGGVEIVVEELATRMVEKGHSVTVYNRKGKHVSGGKTVNLKEYKGVKIKSVPTFENGKLNAIVYSVIATFLALFGRYDVIHFHAEGPCSMIWLPHLFGIHTVATIHGLDWQRAKWGGFATKFQIRRKRRRNMQMNLLYCLRERVTISKNLRQRNGFHTERNRCSK